MANSKRPANVGDRVSIRTRYQNPENGHMGRVSEKLPRKFYVVTHDNGTQALYERDEFSSFPDA
jgi:hypothetical protein